MTNFAQHMSAPLLLLFLETLQNNSLLDIDMNIIAVPCAKMLLGHHELSLALQIRHNSSKLLYEAFIFEVHVLWLRSNVEVMHYFKNGCHSLA